MNLKTGQDGYIALTSVIIVSLLLITVITALSAVNYFSRYNILENEYKERSSGLAEACVDYAIGRVASNPSYAGNNEKVAVAGSNCVVKSVSGAFPKVISTSGYYPQNTPLKSYTNLTVTINSNLRVTNWQEKAN